jgi:hypothetical protein
MQKISERDIRGAIRNCSRGERDTMTLPKLDTVNWDDLEYLGWRDAKAPLRGYLVHVPADEPVGIAVRGSASRVRRTALCDLCHCVHQDGVALYVAPRRPSRTQRQHDRSLHLRRPGVLVAPARGHQADPPDARSGSVGRGSRRRAARPPDDLDHRGPAQRRLTVDVLVDAIVGHGC